MTVWLIRGYHYPDEHIEYEMCPYDLYDMLVALHGHTIYETIRNRYKFLSICYFSERKCKRIVNQLNSITYVDERRN
jgi:hypothetical protein